MKRGSIKSKYGVCNLCGKPAFLNKRGICSVCRRPTTAKKQATSIRNISKKGAAVLTEDDKFYELIWESRPHYCEECGVYLGDSLRDDRGRIVQRWRFSHILPKGRYPKLRHHISNMNLLCLRHHEQWENGDQRSMSIYEPNQVLIKSMMNEIVS